VGKYGIKSRFIDSPKFVIENGVLPFSEGFNQKCFAGEIYYCRFILNIHYAYHSLSWALSLFLFLFISAIISSSLSGWRFILRLPVTVRSVKLLNPFSRGSTVLALLTAPLRSSFGWEGGLSVELDLPRISRFRCILSRPARGDMVVVWRLLGLGMGIFIVVSIENLWICLVNSVQSKTCWSVWCFMAWGILVVLYVCYL